MALQPIGKFIVIKTVDEELKTESGLILSGEDMNQMRYKRGIVIESGTDGPSTSDKPPAASNALLNALIHSAGFTSVPSGWAALPCLTNSPVLASLITTLTDWVEESTPATSFLPITRVTYLMNPKFSSQ